MNHLIVSTQPFGTSIIVLIKNQCESAASLNSVLAVVGFNTTWILYLSVWKSPNLKKKKKVWIDFCGKSHCLCHWVTNAAAYRESTNRTVAAWKWMNLTTLMVTDDQVHLSHLLTKHSNDGVWRSPATTVSYTSENFGSGLVAGWPLPHRVISLRLCVRCSFRSLAQCDFVRGTFWRVGISNRRPWFVSSI